MSLAALLRPRQQHSSVSAQRKAISARSWTSSGPIQELVLWTTSFLLSLAQWRHAAFFFGNCTPGCDMSDVIRAVQAEFGVVQGYPHWRFFQSRVLGPFTEQGLHLLLNINFVTAHMIVAVIAMTVCGGVMFHAGRAVGGRPCGWAAMFAFQTLFVLLMARPWLYVWDYFVVLFAAIFMLLVIRRAPWWAFLALMAAAFFNHETALFIGVWMVAQSLADAWAERRHPDWRMLAGGVLGSGAGILLIEFLRRMLLKQEIGRSFFQDGQETPSGWFDAYFHVQVSANLDDIYHWLTAPGFDLMILIVVPPVVALILAACLIARYGLKTAGLAIYAVAQVTALFLFGLRGEARDLLGLMPFLCLAGMMASHPLWTITASARGPAHA